MKAIGKILVILFAVSLYASICLCREANVADIIELAKAREGIALIRFYDSELERLRGYLDEVFKNPRLGDQTDMIVKIGKETIGIEIARRELISRGKR